MEAPFTDPPQVVGHPRSDGATLQLSPAFAAVFLPPGMTLVAFSLP
jgi:hypothetical protein